MTMPIGWRGGLRTTIAVVGLLIHLPDAAGNGNESSEVASNLSVMREIAVEIGSAAGEQIRETEAPDTLWAIVRPRETAWYVESSLLQGITSHGYTVLTGDQGALTAEFGLVEMKVRYSDARAEGLFGETIADREVMVTISVAIANQRTGEIHVDRDIIGSRRDTIALSDIATIENPNIAVTHGEMPDEGFFSSFAGPLIVLGALGIAVYLLFHVRS